MPDILEAFTTAETGLPYGENTFIDPEVIIDQPQSMRIGANCTIGKGVILRSEDGEIVIGDNCVVNHNSVFHGKGVFK